MKTEEDIARNQLFKQVYADNLWQDDESASGQGSSAWVCEPLIAQLPPILARYGVASMLDIPCGDFNWMQHVQFPEGFSYIGGDVVPEIIERNNSRYQNDGQTFRIIDIINDPLPATDLLFVRDLFIHLTLPICRRGIENIAKADFRYAMFTHDPLFSRYPSTGNIELERAQHGANYEFRPISMMHAPFNLPEPITYITEHPAHSVGWGAQKQMAMWTKEQIVAAISKNP